MSAIIWHNPKCSKSREALKILEDNGIEARVYKYLDEKPSVLEIKAMLEALGCSARKLMRTKEAIYKELDLKNETDEENLILAMHNHPELIERPIVVKDSKAIIGRPPSLILDLI